MWWLSFRDGTAVVMRATSLLHARMLATIHKIGFVSQFASGYQLSPELAALIPDDCVGRKLSGDDTRHLHDRLEKRSANIQIATDHLARRRAAKEPGSLRLIYSADRPDR